MRSMMCVLMASALAGCTQASPPVPPPDPHPPALPAEQPRSEFQPSHHAVVEGVVTSRGGQPLDSVTVVAWRMAEGHGSVLQTRAPTDGQGRFRLPVLATIGPEPTPVPSRVVIRGFAWGARYPRGPGGSVAMDSTIVAVTLVPLAQKPPMTQARITLPLP